MEITVNVRDTSMSFLTRGVSAFVLSSVVADTDRLVLNVQLGAHRRLRRSELLKA